MCVCTRQVVPVQTLGEQLLANDLIDPSGHMISSFEGCVISVALYGRLFD